MTQVLSIVQFISAVLLIIAILLQQRGSGLGSVFGGEGAVFRAKRGVEKILFISTIVLAIIFFASALARVIL